MFKCEYCNETFTRKDNRARHIKNKHLKRKNDENTSENNKKFKLPTKPKNPVVFRHCELCDINVENSKFAGHIKSDEHKKRFQVTLYANGDIEKIDSAFKNRIVSYRVKTSKKLVSVEEFINEKKDSILDLLNKQYNILRSYKFNMVLFANYVKSVESKLITEIKTFNTKNEVICNKEEIHDKLEKLHMDIVTKSEEFQEKDSGWALKEVLYIEIHVNSYNPLKGSSYIDLPKKIKDKHAVINIQTDDDKCFLWAIMAGKFPTENNPHRVTSYPHYRLHLNTDKLEFPIKIKDIKIFEKLNNVSINVYGIEGDEIIGPLYFAENKKLEHYNLLYIENDKKSHYCLIKCLSRLIGSRLSKNANKKWICDGCLLYFSKEKLLENHIQNDCNRIRTYVPHKENDILKFKNFERQYNVPFVIYADIECILEPIHTCKPEPNTSYTEVMQTHKAYSFALYLKCSYDDSKDKFLLYRGHDCIKQFLEKLNEIAKEIYIILRTKIAMKPLTNEERKAFENADKCHICDEKLGSDRVRDHDHLTGLFRGAAHTNCNLNYSYPNFIPVIFHNLTGYDSHFIIQNMDDSEIDILANSAEKYISFTKHVRINDNETIKLRFLDSFRFFSSSLASVAESMDDSQFIHTRKRFGAGKKFEIMRKKGIFPYEYVDNLKKLEQKFLPPKTAFFSKLNNEGISDAEYSRAHEIWNEFKINDLGEYSDLYLTTDVLLLTDIFENFRKVSLKTYGLDPSHYYTAPGFSWDAMLKMTKVELQLLTDIDMIHFLKKSIRGGICQCITKFSQANNQFMRDYDEKEPSKYIMYFDANNQYGWAMTQYLPIKNFRWLSENEMNQIDFSNLSETNDKGYILEVDLEYPKDLYDLHNELPFCPENKIPPYKDSKNKKLLVTLNDKEKYVLHYRSLIQCLEHGLKLKKIHRVLEFDQCAWLKPYIELNNNLRIKSKSNFEKNSYKLANNAIFGKTMENIDKRIDIKLINIWDNGSRRQNTASKLISRINFHSRSIINENLVLIRMNKTKVYYNKPIYVGFSVLEISKILMYDFHYNYIKKKFKHNSSLLYMDTDSFIYEFRTDNIYNDIKTDLNLFDTSDYKIDNKYGLPQINKKVLGKFKDECAGDIILLFAGLKAKTYCIVTENEIKKKIKGIKKCVVEKHINVEDYINCIKDSTLKILTEMMIFRSRNHQVYTECVNKLALYNNDDKRFSIPNCNKTLAWGHEELNNYYFM